MIRDDPKLLAARIDLRICKLRVLATQTIAEYWRARHDKITAANLDRVARIAADLTGQLPPARWLARPKPGKSG
jgi:hypothetical protein